MGYTDAEIEHTLENVNRSLKSLGLNLIRLSRHLESQRSRVAQAEQQESDRPTPRGGSGK